MKYILITAFIILTSAVRAQTSDKTNFVIAQFNAGYSYESKVPLAGIEVGARLNDFYISAQHLHIASRKATAPSISIFNAGYNISHFKPFISYGYSSIGQEAEARFKGTPDEFIDHWAIGYGVTYSFSQFPLSITLQRQDKQTILSTGMYVSF